MMLNANKLFVATAAVFGFLWIICSALVAVLPGPMLRMTGYMVHAQVDGFAWSLSWAGFIGGLVLWSLLSGLIVWLVARVYNRISA
jgi:hypothetical protein